MAHLVAAEVRKDKGWLVTTFATAAPLSWFCQTLSPPTQQTKDAWFDLDPYRFVWSDRADLLFADEISSLLKAR
ncbi:MAG: hypothetical protein U0936_03010 [Planctomycetaceae bacterium]